MLNAPTPVDETERLADVRALNLLDTPPEERFDRIVKLAASIFDVPIAYIALIDADRQWFKSRCGVAADQTDRSISFCGHAIMGKDPLIVPDASKDDRFADNPLVVGDPYVRFYAGCPLAGPGGHNVATLCIADHMPRELSIGQVRQLRQLATLAEHELGMMDLIRSQRELLEIKNQLVRTRQRLADELDGAAAYVRSLLPPRLDGEISTRWQFVCSSHLGGDLFGYHWLDDDQLAIYLLDVCGHGVTAALLSISIFNDLRLQTLPATRFDDPVDVCDALNRAFPMDRHGQKFFTIWYGVYNRRTRAIRYAAAGHPPGVLLNAAGPPVLLGSPNLPIGIVPGADFSEGEHVIAPESRLYLLSDGVYEVVGPDGRLLMLEGFLEVLRACADQSDVDCTQCVLAETRKLQGSPEFNDDFSLLEVAFE